MSNYKMTKVLDHPRRHKNNRVYSHTVIAEKALGKYLPEGSEVHHADCNKLNNSNNNLVICQDKLYHMLLHNRIKAKQATGNPNLRKCSYCKKWDGSVKSYKSVSNTGGVKFKYHHTLCANTYNKKYCRKNNSQVNTTRRLRRAYNKLNVEVD